MKRARRWIVGLGAVGLVACVLVPCGCAWRVSPPETVTEPVTVRVTQYARHTRLALPAQRPGEGWVEYGFGDWDYYGREDRSIGSGLRAILGFGTAARSRRELPPAAPGDFVRVARGEASEELQVERETMEALRRALEAHWAQIAPEAILREWDGVTVAPSREENYHLFRNSNHATAAWLQDLGCRVSGFPVLSDFRVKAVSKGTGLGD